MKAAKSFPGVITKNKRELIHVLPDNPSPGDIEEYNKQKKQAEAEYRFLNATIKMGLSSLAEKVQKKEISLKVHEIAVLNQLKMIYAREDLESINSYFSKCDLCGFYRSCNLYKPEANCSYNLSNEIKTASDAVEIMKKMLSIQSDRIMRGLLIEKLDGGVVDTDVTNEMMVFFEMMQKMKEIMDVDDSVTIKAKGKGAITKLFSDLFPQNKPTENISPESISPLTEVISNKDKEE